MDRVDYQSLIIQDLFNDFKSDKLNLNPWYQRRSVWTKAQKSYLINTLFERKPIPAIYIRHSINLEKQISIKEVVDGQQRSRAILEYCQNEFAAKISLDGPKKFFRDLSTADKESLLLTPLPVGFLLGATDEDVIDIFARINSVSKTLNPQEKRNALYSGEMKQYCLRFASQNLSFWRSTNVFSTNDVARMNEVQFVSELVLSLLNGLSPLRQPTLNAFYKEHDDEFVEAANIFGRLNRIFDDFINLDENVFKNTIFNRPPVLFSLILCLDDDRRNPIRDLEEKMYQMDAEFSDEDNASDSILGFRRALASSTQQMPSRKIRREFIAAHL